MKTELKLSPKAKNALLYLVFSGKELPIGRLDIKFRKELLGAKLVEEKPGGDGKRKRKYVALRGDKAWADVSAWLDEIQESKHPSRGKKPSKAEATPEADGKLTDLETFTAVLATLKVLMTTHGLELADVVSAATKAAALKQPAPTQPLTDQEVERRILESYIALARSWYKEVRLRELRPMLNGIPKEQVDGVLQRLAEEKRLSPFPIENPRERTHADETATLILGVTHHHCVRIKES
jgi:hypothetical protein